MRITILALCAALGGCAHASATDNPQDRFFANLTALCGKSFAGTRISNDPQDADFADKSLVMHVRDCTADQVRIPFHVGEDHSRTWVVTRTPTGLRLKHDHRHEDGTEDALSQYGGDTVSPGTAERQEFPADAFSKELFTRQNATVSLTNVWAYELRAGQSFIYELKRPGRDFRVSFDLANPIG